MSLMKPVPTRKEVINFIKAVKGLILARNSHGVFLWYEIPYRAVALIIRYRRRPIQLMKDNTVTWFV